MREFFRTNIVRLLLSRLSIAAVGVLSTSFALAFPEQFVAFCGVV